MSVRSGKSTHVVPHILIIGGGFAGTAAARELADSTDANITLISNKTYFEYYPAFHRVVTGAKPVEVCFPLDDVLPKGIDVVNDTITSIDLENKTVRGKSGNTYAGDYVIFAMGSQTSYFDLPGIEQNSFGFKSIAEAAQLKEHIKKLFENLGNKHAEKPRDLVSKFRIVIVGGGPTGVEVAGDLSSYMKLLAGYFGVDPSFVSIELIDRGSRLISSAHPGASAAALKRLRKLGVNIFLNREVVSHEGQELLMGDMSLETRTVIWTAGTVVNDLYRQTSGFTFTLKKRVKVNNYLEAEKADGTPYQGCYVVGDGAGTPFSGLAQTAIFDGGFVARDIAIQIKMGAKNKPRQSSRLPYIAKPIDYIIPIGRDWAIMSFGGGRWYMSGFVAYVIRAVVDFMYFAKMLPLRKLLRF